MSLKKEVAYNLTPAAPSIVHDIKWIAYPLPIDPFKNRPPVTFECILVYLQELNFNLKNIHIYRVNESLSQGFLPIKI